MQTAKNSDQKRLSILQVNTNDLTGGAAKSTWSLFQNYKNRGMNSWLAVGSKKSHDNNVFTIQNEQNRSGTYRFLNALNKTAYERHNNKSLFNLCRKLARVVSEPRRSIDIWKGIEDFHFPGTRNLLHMCPQLPDIIHCRNLHGRYFDLRALPHISNRIPTIITLADAWLLSGHCAHSLECDRWLSGCGNCPDLSRYPSIRKDMTRKNWSRKKAIYQQSRYYVTSASEWMINRVKQSMLMEGAVDVRVIPNGIDLSCFRPREKKALRRSLDIPCESIVLLFAANGITNNIYKNFSLLRNVLEILNGKKSKEKLHFIALGETQKSEQLDRIGLHFIPYQTDPNKVAAFYQAADIYMHAAKAEVWGLTVTEALACGVPVVATDVGGIKEQVVDDKTGYLTSPSDPEDMAGKITTLIEDPDKRKHMGTQARKVAETRFDLHRMVDDYLDFYAEVIDREKSSQRAI